MNHNANGRRWARFWLVVALMVSTIGNVTHAVLADSDITLWLRVPGAVIWPVFTFAGIEILVRMIWERRLSHTITRWVLMSAAVPAAITSYEHQYTLLGMMGETQFIQSIGPLAIDGAMIGCTMALLFTRSIPAAPAPITELAPVVSDEQLEQIVERWTEQLEQPSPWRQWTPTDAEQELAERMAALEQPEQTTPRAPRAGKPEQEKAVTMMLAGQRQEAVDSQLMGDSTMRRYERVMRALVANPASEIDCKKEKVNPTLVDLIRAHANLERSR